MTILIDGHNLIGASPELELDEPDAVHRLVLKLRGWAARERRGRVLLAFDGGVPGGPDPSLSGGGLEVVFAPRGSSADQLLLNRLRKDPNPRGATLVSSDRELRQQAERLGARWWPAEELLRRLAPTVAAAPEKPGEPAPGEVEHWLEIFGGSR